MNWLNREAIYLSADAAEEFKDLLTAMSELAEDCPNTDREREYRNILLDLKAFELIEFLVERAIDGVPKDMQRKIEEVEHSMLCVLPGGRAYERCGSLSRN